MAQHPSLSHISVTLLTGEAGGDPWSVDETLQSGDPAEIAELSRAFFSAGECTAETYAEFVAAQQRFGAAWNRTSGRHPINDAAEVRRATESLGFQRDHIPVVAATLAGIAAELSEKQQLSGTEITALNIGLSDIDTLIGRALAGHRSTAALEQRAIDQTAETLSRITGLRDRYCTALSAAQTRLRVNDNYDPALDGDGSAQKLDDSGLAGFVGPLPVDPILGDDGRDRARARIAVRRQLEEGSLGVPPMNADEATAALDAAEHFGRVAAAQRAILALTGAGMSRSGAERTVSLLSAGTPWRELADTDTQLINAAETAVAAGRRSAPTNVHALGRYSTSDRAVLHGLERRLGIAGRLLEGTTAIHDLVVDGASPWEVTGSLAGGAAGSYAAEVGAWALLGSTVGPEGAAIAGAIGAVVLSDLGSRWGGRALASLGD